MAGNSERECLKTSEIGQSAAKPQDLGKVQRLSRKGVGSKRSRSARCTKRWARRHDRCVSCGTIARPHRCKGKCGLCYDRDRRPEKDCKRHADPVKREQHRLQSLAWKDRNRVKVLCDARCYYHENRDVVLLAKNEANHGGYYLEVLTRDNFTCQRCGKENVNLVHHMQPGNHDPALQIAMCVECHISIHHQKELSDEDRRFFV